MTMDVARDTFTGLKKTHASLLYSFGGTYVAPGMTSLYSPDV